MDDALLAEFGVLSNGQVSKPLSEMLRVRTLLKEKYASLDREVAEAEQVLTEQNRNEVMSSDYVSVLKHLKVMCPRAFNDSEPSLETFGDAAQKIPWLAVYAGDEMRFVPPNVACKATASEVTTAPSTPGTGADK